MAGLAVADDAVMIDLAEMKDIRVDPESRMVRAEGGVTWAELNAAAGEYGLAVTGGAVSTTGIAGFTLGGLRTTVDSEVLHVSGEPIPGLFAAGRCTSGVCAGGYASGTSLGDGSFFGRRAGISAAKG